MSTEAPKLEYLTERMEEHKRYCAKGSECQAWQDYCEACYSALGCAPWDSPELILPFGFAVYWIDVAEGSCLWA